MSVPTIAQPARPGGAVPTTPKVTLADRVQRELNDAGIKGRRADTVRARLGHILAHPIAQIPLLEILNQDIADYRRARIKECNESRKQEKADPTIVPDPAVNKHEGYLTTVEREVSQIRKIIWAYSKEFQQGKTRKELAKDTGISSMRLLKWERMRLVRRTIDPPPGTTSNRKRMYSPIGEQAAVKLDLYRSGGLSMQAICRAVPVVQQRRGYDSPEQTLLLASFQKRNGKLYENHPVEGLVGCDPEAAKPAQDDGSLAALFEHQYLPSLKPPDLAESSKKNYLTLYNKYVKGPLGSKKLSEVSTEHISGLRNGMRDRPRPCSHSRINDCVELIERAYKYAVREDLYEGDLPTKDLPPLPVSEPDEPIYPLEHLQKFVSVLASDKPFDLWFLLTLLCKLVPRESCAIRWLDTPTTAEGGVLLPLVLRIRQKHVDGEIVPLTSRYEIRDVPIPRRLATMLAEWRQALVSFPEPEGFVFANGTGKRPHDHHNIYNRRLRPRSKNAGVPWIPASRLVTTLVEILGREGVGIAPMNAVFRIDTTAQNHTAMHATPADWDAVAAGQARALDKILAFASELGTDLRGIRGSPVGRKAVRPLRGERDRRLLEFRQGQEALLGREVTLKDILVAAAAVGGGDLDRRELKRWRDEELPDSAPAAQRIEEVLNGQHPIKK